MDDKLLKEIQNLKDREESRQFQKDKTAYKSRINQMREDMGLFHRYLYQLAMGFRWVWVNVLSPVRRLLSSISGTLFGWYRRLWAVSVYERDKYDDLVFSKTRAGLFLTATFLSFYCAYMIAGFTMDATLYLVTYEKNETIYLTNSQEIDPAENIHSIQGCTSLPCDGESSIYFRVEPTAFNHVWSIFHNGNIFYPDYISAAVPPGVNRCNVSSYGVRLKFMMRGLDIYPSLLRASCEPVKQ